MVQMVHWLAVCARRPCPAGQAPGVVRAGPGDARGAFSLDRNSPNRLINAITGRRELY